MPCIYSIFCLYFERETKIEESEGEKRSGDRRGEERRKEKKGREGREGKREDYTVGLSEFPTQLNTISFGCYTFFCSQDCFFDITDHIENFPFVLESIFC